MGFPRGVPGAGRVVGEVRGPSPATPLPRSSPMPSTPPPADSSTKAARRLARSANWTTGAATTTWPATGLKPLPLNDADPALAERFTPLGPAAGRRRRRHRGRARSRSRGNRWTSAGTTSPTRPGPPPPCAPVRPSTRRWPHWPEPPRPGGHVRRGRWRSRHAGGVASRGGPHLNPGDLAAPRSDRRLSRLKTSTLLTPPVRCVPTAAPFGPPEGRRCRRSPTQCRFPPRRSRRGSDGSWRL